MATRYVDTTTGGDGDNGTTEELAWATIDKAMNEIAGMGAGPHLIYVKGSASYTELATIDTAGTNAAQVVFEGYTATPGDNGIATMDGEDARANCIAGLAGSTFYTFKNFRFTQATGVGFSAITGDYIQLIYCRFDNNGGDGCEVDDHCTFYGCYFHDNDDDGLHTDSDVDIVNCIFWGNDKDGAEVDDATFVNCLFVDNGGNGINFISTAAHQSVINCTIDGNGKVTNDGISFSDNANNHLQVINCIIYDCTTGIDATTAGAGARRISFNNLLNSNTDNYSNFDTDEGEVTDAPAFVNEGTDYTPGVASPAKNAGADLSTLPWGLTISGAARSIGCMEPPAGGGAGKAGIKTGGRM